MTMAAAAPLLHRRVVVTGMGAITPLGNTLVDSWNSIVSTSDINNPTGITDLRTALEWQNLPDEQMEREWQIAQTLPCQVAAAVKSSHLTHDTRTPRFVQLALEAGREALQNAGLLVSMQDNNGENPSSSPTLLPALDPTRMGACVGSGMSGVREIVEAARLVEQRGIRRLSPHFVPKVLSNSAAGRLSLQYGLQGPNHSVSTACAAGTHALGDAMRCIQYGNADVMLAGGAESCIDPLSMAGFSRLKALSTNFNDAPYEASRPFDKDRDGFVMGEGSAVLVLEELEHAQQRGATILAELCGYGLTGDAHHITAPAPEGGGAERAMQMAIAQAAACCDITIAELSGNIGYVNAHATSTPKGDEIEGRCLDRLFGGARATATSCTQKLRYVSSTKGATGHLLGAAGAIEAAIAILALRNNIIPPTRNLQTLDPAEQDARLQKGFEHVTKEPIRLKQESKLHFAMSNSFGFGGTNASIVLRRY